MISNLLVKAALRVSSVNIAGEIVYVKEPTHAEINAWSGAPREDMEAATAKLFQACVLHDDGKSPLSPEEAKALASSSVRVMQPLIAAIMASLNPAEAKND